MLPEMEKYEALRTTIRHIHGIEEKVQRLQSAKYDAFDQFLVHLKRSHKEIPGPGLVQIYCDCMAMGKWFEEAMCDAIDMTEEDMVRLAQFGRWENDQLRGWGFWPLDDLTEEDCYWPTPAPGTPCVYVLMNEAEEIVYIGKSRNVRARLRTHWENPDKRPYLNSWEVRVCVSLPEMDDLEAILIHQHRPILNKKLERRNGAAV
jgi:predicted GIY-YIG superfamily endonuclease